MNSKQTTIVFGVANGVINECALLLMGINLNPAAHIIVPVIGFVVAYLIWRKLRGYEMYGAAVVSTMLTAFLSSYFSLVLIFLCDVFRIGDSRFFESMDIMELIFFPLLLSFYLFFYVGIFVTVVMGIIGCVLAKLYRRNNLDDP